MEWWVWNMVIEFREERSWIDLHLSSRYYEPSLKLAQQKIRRTSRRVHSSQLTRSQKAEVREANTQIDSAGSSKPFHKSSINPLIQQNWRSGRGQDGLQLLSATVDRSQYEDGACLLGEGTHSNSARWGFEFDQEMHLTVVNPFSILYWSQS